MKMCRSDYFRQSVVLSSIVLVLNSSILVYRQLFDNSSIPAASFDAGRITPIDVLVGIQ